MPYKTIYVWNSPDFCLSQGHLGVKNQFEVCRVEMMEKL